METSLLTAQQAVEQLDIPEEVFNEWKRAERIKPIVKPEGEFYPHDLLEHLKKEYCKAVQSARMTTEFGN